MASFTAHLQQGRLVIDDEGDELDEEERGRLEAVMEASFEASARGDSYSAEQVMADLRALRAR